MNIETITALLRKDLILFFSNRFFTLITVLGVVAYAGIYYLLPEEVEEILEMAIFAPGFPSAIIAQFEEEGLVFIPMDSLEDLKESIMGRKYPMGVALSPDFTSNLAAGRMEQVQLFFSDETPAEFRDVYVMMFTEIGYMLSGNPLNVEVSGEILGVDRAGEQIPHRDRLLPLMAVFILMIETMGLASLIAAEISTGTLQALMVTPLRVEGLFLAKGILGVSLAFTQACLLLAITGGLNRQPLIILAALFLGSVLVTGLGFLIASFSKDLMGTMGWGMLAIIVLSLPSFGVLLPGAVTGWVKIIPSYHLVEPVYLALNFPVTWADVSLNLAVLMGYALLFVVLGILVLRRKLR
jgi:ABC-2 type transport system permease protein